MRQAAKDQARGRPLVALAANDCWNIANYRAGLVRAFKAAGYEVAVLAPDGPHAEAVRALGVDFVPVPIAPRGTSPLGDFRTFSRFRAALRSPRPAAFLGFTAKPNIYGSLAAHALGIPVINNISGLGAVFARPTALTRLVSLLYRAALARSSTVFFQNPDDRELFERMRLVKPEQTALLPGSGVDLERFAPVSKDADQPLTLLFAARLLWDKGVREYVEAARTLRSRYPQVRFAIAGIVEPTSRSAVPEAALAEWQAEGLVTYLGALDDIRPAIAAADCVVLPSYYREGTPRILLEAAAMAKPIVTTDSPGCREAVGDEVTGLLCAARRSDSLATALDRIVRMSASEREAMGAAGRLKMEREFAEHIVHRAYLDALAKLGLSGR